jgi:hypothetical protein
VGFFGGGLGSLGVAMSYLFRECLGMKLKIENRKLKIENWKKGPGRDAARALLSICN